LVAKEGFDVSDRRLDVSIRLSLSGPVAIKGDSRTGLNRFERLEVQFQGFENLPRGFIGEVSKRMPDFLPVGGTAFPNIPN